MTFSYRLLIRLLLPLVFVYLWLRGRKAPAYRQRWRERLALQPVPPTARDGLVVHCVSVGETVAARGFIEGLLEAYPQLPVTLTSMTPTAADLAYKLFTDRVHHYYLPLDTPGAMRRFFNKLAPRAVLILETELWPCLLEEADSRNIPVVVLNARMSDRSARSYRNYAWLVGPIWPAIRWLAAQTDTSAQRFLNLGMQPEQVAVRGNLKFDFQLPDQLLYQAQLWREQHQRPVVVAASTHQGEDEQVITAFQKLLQSHPDALLILVPRHPERFAAVGRLIESSGLQCVSRSSGLPVTSSTAVLLGDTMGELLFWYAVADAAFIGGSLIERGGHNPLEPIATNTPVVSGRTVFNFQEIYDRLNARDALLWADSASGLAEQWQRLLDDDELRAALAAAARDEFATDQGATRQMLADVKRLIPPPAAEVRTLKMITVKNPDNDSEIWFDAKQVPDLTDAFFSPEYWRAANKIKGSATGRSTAWFIDDGRHGLLLRHYYRGGMVGKLNKDRFKREAVAHSRAMAEFSLLLQLRELDLAVPRPVAARYQKAPLWGYRADILVETIPDAKDVFHLLQARQLTTEEWQILGREIRKMHELGVYHSDLNCHNLMLDVQGKAWLVDFDKCGFRSPGEWRQANLDRLLRSFTKEANKAKEASTEFFWLEERDWPLLMAGYQFNGSAD
ncbi:3-deoxy-D-manno-octulosonic acid transferase [Pseudidiomarina salinarum]|uniref:3-deoxy-D-manno-octulosonic acid kinase n=1 Tax=Pseudidiomarina salinarum TaxID=435908 RepID=A0A094IST2_9GAMM|nr:lipid IV(A) 3-deoxy-D-manno-octulosonic acid transferase [Pseudidiomarina salinarum]KFZ30212.1 3-deoxy-D-manno-octulosonic acid transferase [Pseudidiomarina salinarum]RUO69910.1 3-deoxy-D-manno-octulosonic acid transferase [Pseudidiomarina salinarum]